MEIDRGSAKCALYADLLNLISDSIYQKIGYMAVYDGIQVNIVLTS